MNSETQMEPRHRWSFIHRLAIGCLVLMTVYIGTFCIFRLLAPVPDYDPEGKGIVIFSYNPDIQQTALVVYRPLVTLIPGHNWYPNRSEMVIINEFIERMPTGEGQEIVDE